MATDLRTFRDSLSAFERGMDMDLPAATPPKPTHVHPKRSRYEKANSLSGHRRMGRKLARQLSYLLDVDDETSDSSDRLF